jgi:hypothetical protein
LLFLPATFVSTLFSTDIVRFQNIQGPPVKGQYSSEAMHRWLEVAIPLTLITLIVCYFVYAVSQHVRDKGGWDSAYRDLKVGKSKMGILWKKGSSGPMLPTSTQKEVDHASR